MRSRCHILLAALLLLGLQTVQGQTFGKKRLAFTLNGGVGGLRFTSSNGPDDLMRLAGHLGCGVQYGFGKRIGLAFNFDRAGARRGILDAGPSRTAGYTLSLHVVAARWKGSELDASLGLGTSTITLAAYGGRLPREGQAGVLRAGLRWSRMFTPTLGWSLGTTCLIAGPVSISDENGPVMMAKDSPLEVGFEQIAFKAGLLVRF